MKIVFLNPYVGMNGGVKVVAIYALALQRRGHEVLVVSLPPPALGWKTRLRLWLQGKPAPQRLKSHLDHPQLNHKVLDANRPIRDSDLPDGDAVVATWWETAEWLAAMSPAKGRKYYLVQGHEVFPGLPLERVRATYRSPMKKIVVSRWLQSILAQEYGQHDVALVNNSVDHAQFFAPPRGKQAVPTVGFLFSHPGPSLKGCDVVLQAVRQLRQRHPDLRVVSFGMNAMPAELAQEIGFLHLPAQDRIRDIYASCDVWLTASRSEGFNLPAMEAMACRTPVVSTRTGWPPEVIVDGVNGYCVEIDDVQSLTDAADRVLRLDDAQWRAMSDRAYAVVANESWERAADQLEKVLAS